MKISGADEAADLDADEIIEINQFVTQPAIIHFSYPIKRSVHFQSVGLEVGVSLPCYVEELDAGFARAKELVVAKTAECLEEANKVLDHLVEQKRQAESR